MSANSLKTADATRPLWQADRTTRAIFKLLLVLAVFYTLFLAKTLMLPVTIAIFLALFCNPLVQVLHRWLPRVVAAIAVMITVICLLGAAIALLAQPAEKWVAAIPYAMEDVAQQLNEVAESDVPTVPPRSTGLGDSGGDIASEIRNRLLSTGINFALNSTPVLLAQILAVIILVYFFLVYGQGLLRKLVAIRPGWSEKRVAVVIVRTIQADISHYVLVVATINTGLGVATALALWGLGVRDPALWGAMAALLNFAPYLGPFVMTLTLSFVGLIQFGATGYALLVPGAFLTLNLIECQLATPTALGNRLHLNPLIVFLWLILWGWMWGAAGMLIGVPLLVCVKIIATHLHSFDPWIKLLER